MHQAQCQSQDRHHRCSGESDGRAVRWSPRGKRLQNPTLSVESDGRSRLSPAARQATRCDSVVTAIDRQEGLSPSHKKWREEVLQKVVIG